MSKMLTFKSNIKCGGCVSIVGPYLDGAEGIISWKVDTEVPEKTLQLEVEGMDEHDIQSLVKKAGFDLQLI